MHRSNVRVAGVVLPLLLAPIGIALAGPPIVIGPGASPPGTPRHPAPLPGHVTFSEQAFERVGPANKGKFPATSIALPSGKVAPTGGSGVPVLNGQVGNLQTGPKLFTEAELIQAAPTRVQQMVQADGTKKWMVVGRHATNTGRPLPPVPLDAYVKQLNQYETWLSGYGLSLRDGALAAGGLKGGPVEKELGLKFRLRNMDDIKKEQERFRLPRGRLDLIPIPDPIKDRFGPVAQQWVREDVTRTAQQVSTASVVFDAAPARVGMTPGRVTQWRDDVLKGVSLKPMAPLLKTMSGCPAKACDYVLNKNVALTDFADGVVNDRREEKERWCDGLMTGLGCIGTMHIVYYSWRKTLSVATSEEALQYFLAHYGTPCDIEKYPALHDMFFGLYKTIESSGTGPINQAEGPPAKSFFDGKLLFQLPYDKECLLDYSGNKWFGASACMRYTTSNIYEKTSGFDFRNTAGTHVGFTVFGLDYDLIDGDASIAWKQGSTYTTPVDVKDAVTGSTLQSANDTRYYQGPGATFAIGPIPLSVSSHLQTTLSVGQPVPDFKQPPLQPDVAGQGVVGIGVGAEAKATVGFDAGIDAYVVAAGVYGNVNLLDAQLTGGIKSTIDPLNNKLRIDRGVGFHGNTMSGEMGVFAEVDVLLYSKRWEIEIAHFDGITKDVPVTNTTYEANAVDPNTIKPKTPCN